MLRTYQITVLDIKLRTPLFLSLNINIVLTFNNSAAVTLVPLGRVKFLVVPFIVRVTGSVVVVSAGITSEIAIVKRHVFRNSFIPIITVLPVAVSGVISGSFFIERVFSIPGAGQYFIQAANERDIPILMGFTLLYALIYLIAIFITDILYTVVDPRIRLVK